MEILKCKRILFLGIGGVSMHQLALFLKEKGVEVFGYDSSQNEYVKKLKENNIMVTAKFKPEIFPVDICVRTPAIKDDNKYVKFCKQNKIKIIDRMEMLNELAIHFKNVIAVAGTHGKSTTAGLIYEILRSSGKKVSCHIGADVFAPRFSLGDDFLVVEACEYNKSFLMLNPTISVVTNVEAEHMDSYKNMFSVHSAFSTFMKRGLKRFAYQEASTRFLCRVKDVRFVALTKMQLTPKLKGEHNLKNISLAVAVCESLGVGKEQIIEAVNMFSGLPRRYEYLGRAKGQDIFIDYAHHPTELNCFLDTYSKEHENYLIVFQPHTFSRTKRFLNEFVSILSGQDNVCIFKEYPARENISCGVSAKQLFQLVKKENPKACYSASKRSLEKKLENYYSVVFVGAGDINQIAKQILDEGK